MLKFLGGLVAFSSPSLSPLPSMYKAVCISSSSSSSIKAIKPASRRVSRSTLCSARRRVRYDDEGDDDKEEYGHNAEIALLELYSQSARDEALLVNAMVDEHAVEVLIFKGFSSCLSYRTSPDPSRSVLPQKAKIKSIDRIKGPFDPTDIEYLEKGLTWEDFKSRLSPN
ncbi:unnamed protein product [Ilex paraguariensis]|uniref:DUF7734 domain-containing protein n=1 Tax=Ilex paraguariensis TaxID=185542 RepID=A0ABC8SRW6_9AQUA